MTIKTTLSGGAYEPPRSTYKMGDAPCDSCGSRQAHEHGALESRATSTGVDDDAPPVRIQREYSRPDYGAARRDPWHYAYGNEGGGPSPATLTTQAEARRQTVEAQDEWHARHATKDW